MVAVEEPVLVRVMLPAKPGQNSGWFVVPIV